MSVVRAWGYAILGILGLVLALHQLGVDVAGAMSAVVQGVEQFLNRPLVVG
jgi:hypothetical protein